jgi:SOS-response transcriptional repressor LexA
MQIGQRIKKIRKGLGFTQLELALKANISRSYLADVENNRYNPSINTLEKIADALNVSVGYLTGKAVSSIITDRLEELKISLSELAQKAGVSLYFLSNLDNVVPDENDYDHITRIANVLGLQPGKLRAALAHQEPPVYDSSQENAAEAFGNSCTDLETYPIGKLIKVPIIGTVTAGPNGLAFEDHQGTEWVDAEQVNGGNFFYLRVKGDSMITEGIFPGDLALVRETPEVGYGALAIAIVNNEEGMIKRVYKKEDTIILQSSNPKYPPQVFKKEEMEHVRIVGEVKMTTRKY